MQPQPTLSESGRRPAKRPRFQTGVLTVVVLVASCGIVFWDEDASVHREVLDALGLAARGVSFDPPAALAADLKGATADSRIEAVMTQPLNTVLSSSDACDPHRFAAASASATRFSIILWGESVLRSS